MKLIAIHIFKWIDDAPILVCYEADLTRKSFFEKGFAKEHLNFHARLIAGRTFPGQKASISLENNTGFCYCWTTTDHISATIIADNDYPEKAAFVLLTKLIMDFRDVHSSNLKIIIKDTALIFPPIEKYLKEW